jgi:hypothetical protein
MCFYKKIVGVIFLFVFFYLGSNAQDLPVNDKTGKITYMEVVESKGMKAAEVYKTLNEWCVSVGFKEIKKDDALLESTYSGSFQLDYPSTKPGRTDKGKVNFTVMIFGKDDKYRYIISDFVHEGLEGAANGNKLEAVQPECGKAGMVPGNWTLVKNKTKAQLDTWIKEMKKKVLEVQNDPSKNKDW